MSEMNFPPLEELMPHRKPMILIDRMISASETGGACQVRVTSESKFCALDGVPAYVGLEYMAQAVAAFRGFRSRNQDLPVLVGYLLGTPEFSSQCKTFSVGQTLRIEVEHVWGEDEFGRFQCAIKDATTGALLQTAGLSVFQPAAPPSRRQSL